MLLTPSRDVGKTRSSAVAARDRAMLLVTQLSLSHSSLNIIRNDTL